MSSLKLLCIALILTGLGCKHLTAPSAQDKEIQCTKLVDEITVAEIGFMAALASVRDLDTANEAAVEIRELAGRFEVISNKFARLGPISKELKFRLLKKMELKVNREGKIFLESVRVFTPEEDKIITPAVELFFEKSLAAVTKAGLYYTSSEYEEYKATAPH